MAPSFMRNIHDMVRNKWIEQEGVNLDEELADIRKVYGEAADHLKLKEENSLNSLIHSMKKFIDIHEEKKKYEGKLSRLNAKMSGLKDDEDEQEAQ